MVKPKTEVNVEVKLDKEIKEVERKKVSEPLPNLMSISEFILSLSKARSNNVESLGAFDYWMRKKGCPKKWPYKLWKENFDEFISRKV